MSSSIGVGGPFIAAAVGSSLFSSLAALKSAKENAELQRELAANAQTFALHLEADREKASRRTARLRSELDLKRVEHQHRYAVRELLIGAEVQDRLERSRISDFRAEALDEAQLPIEGSAANFIREVENVHARLGSPVVLVPGYWDENRDNSQNSAGGKQFIGVVRHQLQMLPCSGLYEMHAGLLRALHKTDSDIYKIHALIPHIPTIIVHGQITELKHTVLPEIAHWGLCVAEPKTSGVTKVFLSEMTPPVRDGQPDIDEWRDFTTELSRSVALAVGVLADIHAVARSRQAVPSIPDCFRGLAHDEDSKLLAETVAQGILLRAAFEKSDIARVDILLQGVKWAADRGAVSGLSVMGEMFKSTDDAISRKSRDDALALFERFAAELDSDEVGASQAELRSRLDQLGSAIMPAHWMLETDRMLTEEYKQRLRRKFTADPEDEAGPAAESTSRITVELAKVRDRVGSMNRSRLAVIAQLERLLMEQGQPSTSVDALRRVTDELVAVAARRSLE